uniref:G_PROTEIN_RECEP_F1_2 domain-containing protein n=1 Tax=Parastrongyloides trichosuri TaxID=131310 RepID=A0A0N5A0D1_PARTI
MVLAQVNFSTETTDCAEQSLLDHDHIRIPIIFIYIVVLLLCLVGNLFTIIVICVHHSMRTATNFFLANLAFADLLVAVFCIGQNMFHLVGSQNSHWPLGEVFCKLYVFVLHMVPCTSIGILVCVSLEKYIAVLHPLLALKLLTPRLRVTMATFIWILSVSVNLPYYFKSIEKKYSQMSACTRELDGEWPVRDMLTLSFFVWYCIPLASIAYIYTRIGMVLWRSEFRNLTNRKSNKEQQEHSTEIIKLSSIDKTDEPNSESLRNSVNDRKKNRFIRLLSETSRESERDALSNAISNSEYAHHNCVSAEVLENRKKVVRLLLAIVCSFAVLTFPHHARLLFLVWSHNQLCPNSWAVIAQPFTYLCMFLSSGINPILYAFMSQRFREAVNDIMKCRVRRYRRGGTTKTKTVLSDIAGGDNNSPSLITSRSRSSIKYSRRL